MIHLWIMKSVLDITIRDGRLHWQFVFCCIVRHLIFIHTYVLKTQQSFYICHTRIQGEGRKGEGARIPPCWNQERLLKILIDSTTINIWISVELQLLKTYKFRIDFFLFILKVANIRCFILIKCSEQKARFKKYVIMS